MWTWLCDPQLVQLVTPTDSTCCLLLSNQLTFLSFFLSSFITFSFLFTFFENILPSSFLSFSPFYSLLWFFPLFLTFIVSFPFQIFPSSVYRSSFLYPILSLLFYLFPLFLFDFSSFLHSFPFLSKIISACVFTLSSQHKEHGVTTAVLPTTSKRSAVCQTRLSHCLSCVC
jgi:hypothetical protein